MRKHLYLLNSSIKNRILSCLGIYSTFKEVIHMFKMILIVAGVVFSTSVFSQTETYSFETLAESYNSSVDNGTSLTYMRYSGRYYFKPITINDSEPFAELDLLQRASSISIAYADGNLETSSLSKDNIKPVTVTGTFIVDDFILALANTTWNKHFTLTKYPAYYYGIDSKTTTVGIGYFVTPKTSLVALNTKNNYGYSTDIGTSLTDKTVTTNSLNLHSIQSFEKNNSLVLDLIYSQIKSEQTSTDVNNEYYISAKYYPTPKYYFSTAYTMNTGDDASSKGKTIELGLGYQITPRFGVLLSTSKFYVDDTSQDTNEKITTVTVGYRF